MIIVEDKMIAVAELIVPFESVVVEELIDKFLSIVIFLATVVWKFPSCDIQS